MLKQYGSDTMQGRGGGGGGGGAGGGGEGGRSGGEIFSHALYQFSLYLQKGIIFMISITLIPNYQFFFSN